MIEIYTLDGESIELSSSEITIELNNSLFNDGLNFKGSLSYPINIANSSKNRRLLRFADQLEVSIKSADIPVQVRLSSKTFKGGLLKIGLAENCFTGFLKLDIGSINDRIREVKLSDIPFKSIELGNGVVQIQNKMHAASANTNWRIIPYTFLPTQNIDFFKDKKPNETTIVNSFVAGNFVVSHPDSSTPVVPYFYLSYVLNQIAEWLGLTLKGNFALHPDIEKVVIYNASGIGGHDHITINASQHLPAMSIANFFKSLSSFFCIRIKVDDNRQEVDISWKKTVFENPSHRDWREKLIAVTDQQFQDSDGYTISAQADSQNSEKGTARRNDEIVFGLGKNKIEAKAGTLDFVTIPIDTQPLPCDKRAGYIIQLPSTPPVDESKQKTLIQPTGIPLRFLFTRGYVHATSSSVVRFPRSSNTGAAFDLKISGEKGLFNYAHKPWMHKVYASKIIKARFLLDTNDLHNLNDEEIIRIRSSNNVSVECLIRKLAFTITHNQDKILAEAELIVLDTARLNLKSPKDAR